MKHNSMPYAKYFGRTIVLVALVHLLVQPVCAAIRTEIANMDRTMLRSCETAVKDAARSQARAEETLLNGLDYFEKHYERAGDKDGVLACRQARAKHAGKSEPSTPPMKVPDTVRNFEARYEAELKKIAKAKADKIEDALNRRQRNLMALHRGLIERGDQEGASLVAEALKSPPAIPKAESFAAPKPTTPPEGGLAVEPQAIVPLTFVRSKKRWEKLTEGRVPTSVTNGTTTLRYEDGAHALLKVMWHDVLHVGDRFSIEIQGAGSVELLDVDGPDAAGGIGTAKESGFMTVEIFREQNQLRFLCNGMERSAFFLCGALRGEKAKAELLPAKLRPAFTLKKDQTVRFRNAKIVRSQDSPAITP